jgi:hypothetical protein
MPIGESPHRHWLQASILLIFGALGRGPVPCTF